MKNSASKVTLRPFTPDDFERLYQWQLQPGMRKYFRNPDPPSWEDHQKWCKNILQDERNHAFIIEYKKTPAGFLRLSPIKDKKSYEISILLPPIYRGKGIAGAALEMVKKRFAEYSLKAYIHPENKKSIALFKKAGFVHIGHDWYKPEKAL